MKRKPGRILLAGLCLLSIIVVTFIPGCNNIQWSSQINSSIHELTLTELWNTIAATTAIQEPSAEMGTFSMNVEPDGELSFLDFTFSGRNNNGKPCVYFVGFGHRSRISVKSYEIDDIIVSRHPASVFEEIDMYGLDSIETGEGGLRMIISFQAGSLVYRRSEADLFHLEKGELLPLEEIMFSGQNQHCTVSLLKLAPNKPVSTTAAAPMLPGERANEIWFLDEDISLAETVVYWNEN